MVDFFNKINKNKNTLDNIKKKMKKFKFFLKIFSIYEKELFKVNTSDLVLFSLGLFFVIPASILSIYFFLSNEISIPLFYLYFFAPFIFLRSFFPIIFQQILKRNLSKKERVFIKKYLSYEIKNNTHNIFIITLKNSKLKKEYFKDIISYFKTNKDKIDKKESFYIIQNKLIKQFKESEISDAELKNYIKYFINSFDITDEEIIKNSYIEIEKLTFNSNSQQQFLNSNKKNESIVF